MKKTWKRVLSAAMTLVMALSALPAGAMAAETEVQSVTLPFVAEGEPAPAPQGFVGGVSALDLVPGAEHTAYVYEGVTEETYYYLKQAFILDAQGNPIVYDYDNPAIPENGTFQVVDGSGNILAYTEPESYYSSVYVRDPETSSSTRYYCIDSEYFMVDEDYAETGIPVGEYSIRLVAGENVYPTKAKVVVVDQDCLLLSYLSVQEFYHGKDEFELYLRLYGFETEEQVSEMSFTMTDENGVKVASSTGNIRDIYADDRGAVEWRLYAQMKVEEGKSLEQGMDYTLTMSYAGEKTLVDGAGSYTRSTSTPSARIEDFLILDPDITNVRITFDGIDPEKNYRVFVTDNSNGEEPLARYEGKIEDDSLVLQLRKGGVIVPATMYESGDFQVELQEQYIYNAGTEWEYSYWSYEDNEYFDNLYRNIRNEYVYFAPYYIKTTARKVTFDIEGQGISYYKGEGDVLSMRDKNGVEVGRCENLTSEVYGYNIILSGELNITGTLKRGTYYLYLNNVQFDTLYVSDTMRGSWGLHTVDYREGAFWKFLDQVSIDYEGIYTGGTATFSFRNEAGVDVLTSKTITGQDMYYTDYKYYEYAFSAEELSALTPGAKYHFVFKSGGNEAVYGDEDEWYVYTTEKTPLDLSGNGELYYMWWVAEAGDTIVTMEFGNENRNMVASDLDALKGITLVNTTTADTFAITGWQNLRMEEGSSWVYADMVLDKPLTVGEYTVYCGGEEIDYFNIYNSAQSNAPNIWSNDRTQNGYLSAENLPQNGVYTAKVYQGYNCVIAEPFVLTLYTHDDEGSDQDLLFNKNVLDDLPGGVYEMRISKDGKFFDSVDFPIIRLEKPIVIIDDEDDDYNDDNDPVINSPEIRIEVNNVGAYGYLRWAETKEALAVEPFQVYLTNRWYGHEFQGEDGPRKLYVELSPTGKADDAENLIVEKELWLYVNGVDYDVQVPEEIQGVKKVKNNEEYTITATTAIPATRLWVAFYDADGEHACQAMAYVGETPEGRHEFALSFDPTDSFYDHDAYNGRFEYEDTQRIEVFALNLSDTYHNNEQYRGDKVGESVERVLIFGDPTRVILLDDDVYTNQASYKLVGYTVANGTVSVKKSYSSDAAIATGTANELGYFEITLPTLAEGYHYFTVYDDTNTIDSSSLTLSVDLTAPVITGATFDYVEGTALIRWGCQDDDVSRFYLYKNNVKIAEIYRDYNTTSYSSNVTAKYNDGNVFTIKAEDRAGNIGTIQVSTDDLKAPTAPGTPFYTVLKAKRVEIEWEKALDNVGVECYHIYRDGVKIGESTTNSYVDKTVAPETAYTYTVIAVDAKDNASPASGELKITTPVAPAGVVVKGEVSSYNPGVSTSIQFKQDGEVAYGATIGATTGSGEANQTFQPEDAVAEGTYDVVISKDGHLDLTIKGVVVGDEDLDLGSILEDITLVAGDVNNDGTVNSDDLNNVWSSDNYLKSTTEDGVSSAADVNGDGKVNSDDLNIIWSTNNYLKVEADCVITLK